MRILATVLAFTLITSVSGYAGEKALTEEQIEGVQQAIKGMPGGCTVEDTAIKGGGGGYQADDVVCEDGKYEVSLDGDFKVTDKVKKN